MRRLVVGVLHFIFFMSAIFLIVWIWSGMVEHSQGTLSRPYSLILQIPPLGALAIITTAVAAGGIITWKKLE